jgi:membrane-associated phospholipid phosphatase
MDNLNPSWSLKSYLLLWAAYMLLPLLLVGSWLFEPTRHFWNLLDLHGFYWLNHGLMGPSPSRLEWWAWVNMKSSEWIFALAIFGTTLCAIYTSKERRKVAWHYFISLVYLGLAVELARRANHQALLSEESLHRWSPSLLVTDALRVSELVPYLKSKDYSYISFPGDHGVAFFTWALFVWRISRWRWGVWAFFIAILCCLPRTVVGAHWISDTFVGGISFAAVLVGSFSNSSWEWDLLKWKR